ncbi:armadillo-type protein [Mycena latifolia]|nr:armadillo-type protein [Mycena latifolia]
MPPLTRQRTVDSILSWWSDNNPPGATISLHAAAKPLIRFMYNRQVLGFIKKNRGTPLSKPTMEIYSSYLAFKYLSPSTKATILSELDARVASENDARAVAESFCLDYVAALLDSPDTIVRISTWKVLGDLAQHESTVSAVLGVNPCVRLRALLSDKRIDVLETAVCALAWIIRWPDGAQSAVRAQILDCLVELLKLPNKEVRRWTCSAVGGLAQHQSVVATDFGLQFCVRLVSLLSDEDTQVVENATYALSWITRSLDGAEAAINANTLKWIPRLLDSPNPLVQRWTCRIMGHLTLHPSTATAALKLNPCVKLVSLWRGNGGAQVRESAIFALSWITQSREGAQAAVAAGTLMACFGELLGPLTPLVERWLGRMLEHLSLHEPIALAVFGAQLASLLW